MKLTKDQIEAIRALSAELADKLESGESVTIEPPPRVWEPQGGGYSLNGCGEVYGGGGDEEWRMHGNTRQTREAAERLARDQRIFNRLHAYREEFAPGYVVPPAGGIAWTPCLCEDGKYRVFGTRDRIVGATYMSNDFCQALCDKLNSGEVVL